MGKVYRYFPKPDNDIYSNPDFEYDQEYVIYDFNLNIGDTFPQVSDYPITDFKIIDKGIIELDHPRRYIKFCDHWKHSYIVIEGLGPVRYGTLSILNLLDMYASRTTYYPETYYPDEYLELTSVVDKEGNPIYSVGETFVNYTSMIGSSNVWEYSTCDEYPETIRMAFRGGTEINGTVYNKFDLTYRKYWNGEKYVEISTPEFEPYLLRETLGKVYLLHSPGTCHADLSNPEDLSESIIYDFTAKQGDEITVFANNKPTPGSVDYLSGLSSGQRIYSLWNDSETHFAEGQGVLSNGILPDFYMQENSDDEYSKYYLKYMYDGDGRVIYKSDNAPHPVISLRNAWEYRSFYQGGYVDFIMKFYNAVEENGKRYFPFETTDIFIYDTSTGKPVLTDSYRPKSTGLFKIREESGKIFMLVPEERVWPFTALEGWDADEVSLYDFNLADGDSAELFTILGMLKGEIRDIKSEISEDGEVAVEYIDFGENGSLEIAEMFGNVSRGTLATPEPTGYSELASSPAEYYPAPDHDTILKRVFDFYTGKTIYMNERKLSHIEMPDAEINDGDSSGSNKYYDLHGLPVEKEEQGVVIVKNGKHTRKLVNKR